MTKKIISLDNLTSYNTGIESKIESPTFLPNVFKFRGHVLNVAGLSNIDTPAANDVCTVGDLNSLYRYSGEAWEEVSQNTGVSINAFIIKYNDTQSNINAVLKSWCRYYNETGVYDTIYLGFPDSTNYKLVSISSFQDESYNNNYKLIYKYEGVQYTYIVTYDSSLDTINYTVTTDSSQYAEQYTTMPAASASTLNRVVQYIGTTTNDYTQGYYYIGSSHTEEVEGETVTVYEWLKLNVQPDKTLKMYLFKYWNYTPSYNAITPVQAHKAIFDEVFQAYFDGYEVMIYLEQYGAADELTWVLYCTGPQTAGGTDELCFQQIDAKYYASDNNSNGYTTLKRQKVFVMYIKQYGSTPDNSKIIYQLKETNVANYIDPTKSYTTSFTPANNSQPATKKYVDDTITNNSIQVTTMPTASIDTLGKVYQFIGENSNDYTKGFFYITIANTENVETEVDGETVTEEVTTYSWENITVQPPQSMNEYLPIRFMEDDTTHFTGSVYKTSVILSGLPRGHYLSKYHADYRTNITFKAKYYSTDAGIDINWCMELIIPNDIPETMPSVDTVLGYAEVRGRSGKFVLCIKSGSLKLEQQSNAWYPILFENATIGGSNSDITWTFNNYAIVRVNKAPSTNSDVANKLYVDTLLNKIVPAFSYSQQYIVGDYVSYNGKIYRCITNSTLGSWKQAEWTEVTTNIMKHESIDNKVTSLSSSSTDTEYPSAKAVYDALSTKQDTLVSGTNIKTINNTSILGSGNINISGGSGSGITYLELSSNLKLNTLSVGTYYLVRNNYTLQFDYSNMGDNPRTLTLTGVPSVGCIFYIHSLDNFTVDELLFCWENPDDNKFYTVITDGSGTPNIVGTLKSGTVDTANNQIISGIKSFNALPRCSAVPTTDLQLVNKSYVDSKTSSVPRTYYDASSQYLFMTTDGTDPMPTFTITMTKNGSSTQTTTLTYRTPKATITWDEWLASEYNVDGLLIKQGYDVSYYIAIPSSIAYDNEDRYYVTNTSGSSAAAVGAKTINCYQSLTTTYDNGVA